jgi:hypothetical protein
LKSKPAHFVGSCLAKVVEAALAALCANVFRQNGRSKYLAGLVVLDFVNGSDLCANEDDQTAGRTSFENKLAFAIAASASLVAKFQMSW